MDTEEKDLGQLSKAIEQSDSWLMRYGMVAPQKHNAVVIDLVTAFPEVKDIEYYVDPNDRKIETVLYLSKWRLLWLWITFSSNKFLSKIISRLEEHFQGYAVRAEMRNIANQKEKIYEDKATPTDIIDDDLIDELVSATKIREDLPDELFSDQGSYNLPAADLPEASRTSVETSSSDSEGNQDS